MLSDICSKRFAILNGMATAGVKLSMLGGIFCDAVSR